jgi:hypothetical protein
MAELLECDDCGALMTAELLRAHQERREAASLLMLETVARL